LRVFIKELFPMIDARERFVALLTALDASERALRRDPPIRGQEDTGDWAICGRDDNDDSKVPIGMACGVYHDGDGWLIYFTAADSSQDIANHLPCLGRTQS
jgi:hypothetical protein